MNKFSKVTLAGVLVASITGSALAGNRWGGTVGVSLSSRFAWGGLGGARNSTDPTQQIGCYLSGNPTGVTGGCSATNAQGVYAGCYLDQNSPGLMTAVQSMASDSYIFFGWDESGRCTWIQTETASAYEPKK
jgi:hypothetical protein